MTEEVGNNHQIAIELNHLSKVYGRGHVAVKALDDVSLHVVEGEIIAIMGPSGSGKTTLLQLIGALLKPTSGDITVSGRNITSLPEKELPRVRLETFGFIFQTANLFSALTASQNVELVINMGGLKGEKARIQAKELLEQLDMGQRLDHKPSKLSGGEQQRVAIARAMANNPLILLADEPTANLDSKTGEAVTELLRDIAKKQGKTVVIVSHDLRIRSLVDRILWLEDGSLRVRWSDGATIDPVCLMVVKKDETANVVEHNGQQYCFCSPECQKEFESNPARYQNIDVSD